MSLYLKQLLCHLDDRRFDSYFPASSSKAIAQRIFTLLPLNLPKCFALKVCVCVMLCVCACCQYDIQYGRVCVSKRQSTWKTLMKILKIISLLSSLMKRGVNSMYFLENVCSLKPLYFVDNLKRDIIYIYFNLEEKTVNGQHCFKC